MSIRPTLILFKSPLPENTNEHIIGVDARLDSALSVKCSVAPIMEFGECSLIVNFYTHMSVNAVAVAVYKNYLATHSESL